MIYIEKDKKKMQRKRGENEVKKKISKINLFRYVKRKRI